MIKTAKDALHDGKPIAAEECINAMAALRTACAGAPKTEMDADPTVADESTLAAGAGEGEGEGFIFLSSFAFLAVLGSFLSDFSSA